MTAPRCQRVAGTGGSADGPARTTAAGPVPAGRWRSDRWRPASGPGVRAGCAAPPGWRSRPASRRACATPTSSTGRWVKYCTKPIRPWASSTSDQHAGGPDRGRRRADRAQREPQRHGQADQQEDQVGVGLGDGRRVQAVALGVRVAGVRAAAGDDHAEHDHRGADQGGQPGQLAQRRGAPATPARPSPSPARRQSAYAPGDQRHGEQEVQPDHPRVEVGQHGDAADHALRRDAQADRQREQDQRAGGAAARAAPRRSTPARSPPGRR